MAGAELLPLDREHTVTLQVPEGPVVGEHVEPVGETLERSTGLVATVLPLSHVGLDDGQALFDGHRAHPLLQHGLGHVGVGVEHGRDELHLAIGVPVEELHPRALLGCGRVAREQPCGDLTNVGSCGGQVGAPRHAPIVEVDPLQEAGDDLAQLAQHEVGIGARLRERVRSHAQQEGLVALAGAVDPHVRQRRCG